MIDAIQHPDVTVVARLRAAPIIIWIAIAASLSLLVIFTDGDPQGSLFYHIFGDLVVPIILIGFAVGAASFVQMYRWRKAYVRYDSELLYRGWWDKWPISNLRGIYVATNWMGVRSLRALIGGSDIELFKAYFALEDVEEVARQLELLVKRK